MAGAWLLLPHFQPDRIQELLTVTISVGPLGSINNVGGDEAVCARTLQ